MVHVLEFKRTLLKSIRSKTLELLAWRVPKEFAKPPAWGIVKSIFLAFHRTMHRSRIHLAALLDKDVHFWPGQFRGPTWCKPLGQLACGARLWNSNVTRCLQRRHCQHPQHHPMPLFLLVQVAIKAWDFFHVGLHCNHPSASNAFCFCKGGLAEALESLD